MAELWAPVDAPGHLQMSSLQAGLVVAMKALEPWMRRHSWLGNAVSLRVESF